MGLKNVIKKWGTYALGVAALTGGMIASNNSSVSAAESNYDMRYLVVNSQYTQSSSELSRITLTDITNVASIESVEDINAIRFTSASIYYSGNTFSYKGYGDDFYIDISDIDNFDLEKHLIKHVVDSSTNERTGVNSYNADLVFINPNGSIEEFLEREDFKNLVQNAFDKCVRSVVKLDDEGVDMSVRSVSLHSFSVSNAVINGENVNVRNVGSTGYNYASGNVTNVDVEFYIRSAEDLLFATMDGSGLFTENDVNNAYDTGYKEGHIDGYTKGSLPDVDSEGKYGYIFNTDESHNNKIVYSKESNYVADTLNTQTFFDMWVDGVYNWYQYSDYWINIDNFTSVNDLTYDDIVRTGNDTIVNSDEHYFWFVDMNYYSESGSNDKLIKFMNNVDFKELGTKVLDLLFENEILVLNEGSEVLNGKKLNLSHNQLQYFGQRVVEEETGLPHVQFDSEESDIIGISFHQHNENGKVSVVKRAYEDLMFGNYIEDGDAIQGIGMYEQGFNDGYEAGKNHSTNNSTGGYTEEDLNNKFNEGFAAGSESVDITADNEQAINDFIISNNMKTEEEYLSYGEEKFAEGKEENANEYAERLNELDRTINNLNNEINELNSKINDYESTDDKYQVGYESGYNAGHSVGYQKGYSDGLSEDIESYGQEKYQSGYNSGYSVGYNKGYETAQTEKDEVIENVEQEKNNLVEQVESLQNDISNLNNRINTLTGTINSMNQLIDTKYQEGYEDGVGSVDITTDNDEVYQKGYDDGYTQCEIDNPPQVTYPENNYEFGFKDGYASGYREGKESVDITVDNQQAIEDYIENENMKTEEEYLSYGKEKYDSGYKNNSFGNQIKRLGSNVGTFFVNLGKGIVQYVAFGWAWDKSGKFIPSF